MSHPPAEHPDIPPKRAIESAVVMAYLMLPEDANPAGSIHGGVVMKHIDTAAGVVAMRHARGNAVTASVDRLNFMEPVYVGELVTFKACLNWIGRSSMEVGVRVEAENMFTGHVRHAVSAYLTLVALDENGKSKSVAPLLLETDDQRRREQEARFRRELRHKAMTLEAPCHRARGK